MATTTYSKNDMCDENEFYLGDGVYIDIDPIDMLDVNVDPACCPHESFFEDRHDYLHNWDEFRDRQQQYQRYEEYHNHYMISKSDITIQGQFTTRAEATTWLKSICKLNKSNINKLDFSHLFNTKKTKAKEFWDIINKPKFLIDLIYEENHDYLHTQDKLIFRNYILVMKHHYGNCNYYFLDNFVESSTKWIDLEKKEKFRLTQKYGF